VENLCIIFTPLFSYILGGSTFLPNMIRYLTRNRRYPSQPSDCWIIQKQHLVESYTYCTNDVLPILSFLT
jgi:hypothetical protein